jgi:hypothetical protein
MSRELVPSALRGFEDQNVDIITWLSNYRLGLDW